MNALASGGKDVAGPAGIEPVTTGFRRLTRKSFTEMGIFFSSRRCSILAELRARRCSAMNPLLTEKDFRDIIEAVSATGDRRQYAVMKALKLLGEHVHCQIQLSQGLD